jgi:2-desacetyl-2-hydroxyethyl bacteriochlorophyllide A dehydrogenase
MHTDSGSRAAVLVGPGEIEIRRRPTPEPSALEALIRVSAMGVCGTDVDIYRGDTPVARGRVLGHEGAGLVVGAPAGTGFEAGAPVVVDPTIACGECALCREDLPNLCARGGLLGRERDGLFADEVAVPASNLHLLPDRIRLVDAPLLQVLATVVHAQDQLQVVPGRPAAVVGLGCTGQLHAQLLRHRGAPVLGVTRSAGKQELAARLSCEWVAAPDEAPAVAAGLDALGGADVVVESAGTLPALDTALRVVRPGGTVLAYGSQTASEGRLSFYSLYKKEVRLLSSRANVPRDFRTAISLAAAGAVSLAPLVTDRLPFEQIGDALRRSAEGALKVLVHD